ncbi:riboflavin synthase [Lentimicrobium sp. L6]|uniref:riboflavin synthase n=1 Tax=Lentimicrobium sp. L6 TaxID=2735916 RepID=UPI00155322B2|nr:riboflavin synthase [Lentimicrobium sp. L6]NPD85221.1 riboflavin synthase [Lentimicrobium sp. L6]
MFTGLIEEVGEISSIRAGQNSYQFTIKANKVLEDVKIGDSVCTNGACLTVTAITSQRFTVDIMSETVEKTNFSELKIGSKVNLERALRLSDRLGGHLVSGHIDGIGKVKAIHKDDIAWRIHISTTAFILHQILDKGSIAIDGISLTIIKVEDDSFEVSIIPHTAQETTLLGKNINDTVNLETDMIGKYVQRFLSPSTAQTKNQPKKSFDMDFLAKNGFLS